MNPKDYGMDWKLSNIDKIDESITHIFKILRLLEDVEGLEDVRKAITQQGEFLFNLLYGKG